MANRPHDALFTALAGAFHQTMTRSSLPMAPDRVERRILLLRGERVMLDADWAVLYGVETRSLVRAVKRNVSRFPADFMFQLTVDEAAHSRSQAGISSAAHGGRRYLPYAFTEHGVAMLSAVLRSERAVSKRTRPKGPPSRRSVELPRRRRASHRRMGPSLPVPRQLAACPGHPRRA
jgi:hypothetical protein